MGATVDVNDIYRLGNHILSELSKFLDSLDNVNASINEFCSMLSEQDGAAITSMKNYITQYRDAIGMAAENLYGAYGQVLPVYEGSFSTLDGDVYAVINLDTVAEVVNAYKTASVWLENETDIVDSIYRKVSGFCEVDKAQAETLYDDMDELVVREQKFREDVIAVEEAVTEGEISMLSELAENSLAYLRSIHDHPFVLKSDNTSHLSPLQHPEFFTSLVQVNGYISQNKDFIGDMSGICQQYNDIYVRDGRLQEGIVKVMHATTLLGGGKAAIRASEIATFGFLKAMDLIFGTSSVVFGAAEGTEGVQDITYASLRELDMESQNVIKSALGDTAYYTLMHVSEVGADASALASLLDYKLVENAMYAGTPDVEKLETGGRKTGIRTEPVNEVLPEGTVTGETSGGKAIELPRNTETGAVATRQVENEAVTSLKCVESGLPEGIKAQTAEVPKAKAVGENISGTNPMERKVSKIEPVRTDSVNEILPEGTVTGKTNGGKAIKSGNKIKVTTNLGNEIDITPSANHTTTTKNPGLKGTPNSSIDIIDSAGNIKTRRWFDSAGMQMRDVDFTNHGNAKVHPECPHEHGTR